MLSINLKFLIWKSASVSEKGRTLEDKTVICWLNAMPFKIMAKVYKRNENLKNIILSRTLKINRNGSLFGIKIKNKF